MSSLRGATSAGKRARSASMMARVSSTLSVVCVMTATFSGSGTVTVRASSTVWMRRMASGASPMVPSTSSWPWWPIRRRL